MVSTSDDIDDVQALLALDHEARERGVHLVVGAGFAPGLTCVLAAHGAARLDRVDEIHVAKSGTGGPACARQHHRAVGRGALDWREGGWEHRPGGSGRELCWFPDPIGAQDCYRAALPDALVLVPAFPGIRRVTARVSATRRDRLTARLPMLWPTHPEGGPGAVRVELRGLRGATRDVVVLGAMDRPAVAAGAVAAVAVQSVVSRRGATPRRRRPGRAGRAAAVPRPSWPAGVSGPPSSRATSPRPLPERGVCLRSVPRQGAGRGVAWAWSRWARSVPGAGVVFPVLRWRR